MKRSTIQEALAAIARGEVVVVADAVDRENEGDLIFAAEKATPETLAFVVRQHEWSDLCCDARIRLDALGLPLMVTENSESHSTAFTVTVDLKHGTTTGISAADRAATIRALADPEFTTRRLLPVPDTSFHFVASLAEFSSGPDTQRRLPIWRVSPDSSRVASFAKL